MNINGRFNRFLMPFGTALLLAGCSGWSQERPIPGNVFTESYNAESVRAAVAQSPTTFDQWLTSEYAALSTRLADQNGDWVDADYFARKGQAASRNESVLPEDNSHWLVPLEVPERLRSQLGESRVRLIAALDGGGRDHASALAARTQSRYDCWVEQMEDDWKKAVDGPCHTEFTASLDELEKTLHPKVATSVQSEIKPVVVKQAVVEPPAAPEANPPLARRQYRIYFDFNESSLTPQARQILQRIAQEKDGTAQIELVGKADRTGSDDYNMKLSQRRAQAVYAALVGIGIPPDRIQQRWVGEREPPVPTPVGVREARNRVAEINLQ